MRKPLLIAFAIILSLTACSNRPVFWLPPEIFNPDPEPVEECKHINLKDVSAWFDGETIGHYPKTGICADCGEEITRDSIEIGTAENLATLGKDLSEYYDIGCYTISIIDDIDMSGKTWPFINLDGYYSDHYYGKNFVIDGNGNTIRNLSTGSESSTDAQGFIAYVWSAVTLEIRDLTLDNASIVASKTATANGVGGFIGYIDSSASVILDGCHLIGSSITGSHWAGGIYGYAAGHADVKTVIEISNCSAKNTEITSSNASIGGIMGHAGGNENTEINVSNSSVTGCTIISTENKEEDGIKAGHILGTNGVGDTVLKNVTFDNTNTVKSNDTEVDTAYGRLKFDGVGSLTIGNDKILES